MIAQTEEKKEIKIEISPAKKVEKEVKEEKKEEEEVDAKKLALLRSQQMIDKF